MLRSHFQVVHVQQMHMSEWNSEDSDKVLTIHTEILWHDCFAEVFWCDSGIINGKKYALCGRDLEGMLTVKWVGKEGILRAKVELCQNHMGLPETGRVAGDSHWLVHYYNDTLWRDIPNDRWRITPYLNHRGRCS